MFRTEVRIELRLLEVAPCVEPRAKVEFDRTVSILSLLHLALDKILYPRYPNSCLSPC
jgi:hypothetical protein